MLTNDIKKGQLNIGKDMAYFSKCEMTVFKIQTRDIGTCTPLRGPMLAVTRPCLSSEDHINLPYQFKWAIKNQHGYSKRA